MYDIRDRLGRSLARVGNDADLDSELDQLCAHAHAQAVANGEGTNHMWHRFLVTNTSTGERVRTLAYRPDPSQPYAPMAQSA